MLVDFNLFARSPNKNSSNQFSNRAKMAEYGMVGVGMSGLVHTKNNCNNSFQIDLSTQVKPLSDLVNKIHSLNSPGNSSPSTKAVLKVVTMDLKLGDSISFSKDQNVFTVNGKSYDQVQITCDSPQSVRASEVAAPAPSPAPKGRKSGSPKSARQQLPEISETSEISQPSIAPAILEKQKSFQPCLISWSMYKYDVYKNAQNELIASHTKANDFFDVLFDLKQKGVCTSFNFFQDSRAPIELLPGETRTVTLNNYRDVEKLTYDMKFSCAKNISPKKCQVDAVFNEVNFSVGKTLVYHGSGFLNRIGKEEEAADIYRKAKALGFCEE